jgi:hypothetical protein
VSGNIWVGLLGGAFMIVVWGIITLIKNAAVKAIEKADEGIEE